MINLAFRKNKKDKLLTAVNIQQIYMYSDKFGFMVFYDKDQNIHRIKFHLMEILDY